MTVDGLNGNELSGTNRMNSSINLDAISEVKVLLNTYKAEFGHSGGANIQIVSKSGGTDLSGSGYCYGKRDGWNATPWENNRAGLAEAEATTSTRRASTSAVRCRFPASTNRRPRRSCSSSTRSKGRRSSGPGSCASIGCRRR